MALQKIEDKYSEQYYRLRDYGEEILRSNPGGSFDISVDRCASQNKPIFKRLYMCLDTCKHALLSGCMSIIGLDGFHLKGICQGHLLFTTGIDGNDGILSIAIAAVEVESKDSWTRFLELLLTDIGPVQSHGWTFISDQQKRVWRMHSNLLRVTLIVVFVYDAYWPISKGYLQQKDEKIG